MGNAVKSSRKRFTGPDRDGNGVTGCAGEEPEEITVTCVLLPNPRAGTVNQKAPLCLARWTHLRPTLRGQFCI